MHLAVIARFGAAEGRRSRSVTVHVQARRPSAERTLMPQRETRLRTREQSPIFGSLCALQAPEGGERAARGAAGRAAPGSARRDCACVPNDSQRALAAARAEASGGAIPLTQSLRATRGLASGGAMRNPGRICAKPGYPAVADVRGAPLHHRQYPSPFSMLQAF